MASFRTLFPSLKAPLTVVYQSVAGMFPLGIAARITVALAAVAVLATAANVLGEKSVSYIRTHGHTAQQPAAPRLIAPLQPKAAAETALAADRRLKELARAIERFGHASEMRAESDSPLNRREYSDAAKTLELQGRLGRPARDYVKSGAALVSVADERRQARTNYLSSMDALNAVMQTAIDGAWRILGRVIARQSLLQLRSDLDTIRQSSEVLRGADQPSAARMDALVKSENAFQATLTAYRAGLARSEGSRWVTLVQDDFSALVSLRKQLVSLSEKYDGSLSALSRQRSLLASAAANNFAAEQAAAGTDSSARTAVSAPDPLQPPVVSEPAPAVDEPLVRMETVTSRDSRTTMAIVTALTLLFTIVVSVLTVRNVVVPVRRFMIAIKQLAKGNARVRVPPGGIRELDAMASAFNEMSERLADEQLRTRTQNDDLETKVIERTRQLQRLAQEDPLTSLPNRRHLQVLLADALDRASRENLCVGVYFVDIDNFKNFNDSLGHIFGDRVLMSVANRLEELVDGRGFVARLGGDEFTVVYENAPSVQAIEELGLSLISAFHQLLLVDDRDFSVSLSVGASTFPEHETTADGLIRAADSALFKAKESGRGQLVMFTPGLLESAALRFATEQGLRRAIDRQEFVLVYQPEVNIETFHIGLVEALLRWRRPDGRLARPGEFLEVAEQSGLISEINEWVLRAAVADAAQWHHGGWPDVRVAINVSSRQLLDPQFTARLVALLQEHALPTRCIEIELTETVLQTGPLTIATLHALRAQGIGIALDDFGTGYSSITSLQELPLSRVKLDRSLIAKIDTSERAAVITRAIIELCAGLALEVTAEGIERPLQLAWLLNHSPMFLQGYLLSHAVPFDEMLELRALMPQIMQDLLLSAAPAPLPRAAQEIPAGGLAAVTR